MLRSEHSSPLEKVSLLATYHIAFSLLLAPIIVEHLAAIRFQYLVRVQKLWPFHLLLILIYLYTNIMLISQMNFATTFCWVMFQFNNCGLFCWLLCNCIPFWNGRITWWLEFLYWTLVIIRYCQINWRFYWHYHLNVCVVAGCFVFVVSLLGICDIERLCNWMKERKFYLT